MSATTATSVVSALVQVALVVLVVVAVVADHDAATTGACNYHNYLENAICIALL